MHRARLRRDRREDHDDRRNHVHRDHVRQDHAPQGRRDDLTAAHQRQAACLVPLERPKAPVLPVALRQEELRQTASPLLAVWQVLEPASSVQQQVPAVRQAELLGVGLLQVASLALRLVALLATWGVRLPAAAHRAHDAQGDLRRARDVQPAALALMELRAQRSALAERRAGLVLQREVPAAWDAAAEQRPEGEASGAAVRPQAAAQQEEPEGQDARQEEPLAAVVAAQQGVRPGVQQQVEQPQGVLWVAPSAEP